MALHTLARVSLDAYDYEEAEKLAKQAVAKFQAAKSRQGEAGAGNTLAKIYPAACGKSPHRACATAQQLGG
eukprot:8048143-Pyramimonas_sp.AAC.1